MPETVEQTVRRVAQEEGVSPELLWAIVLRESGGKVDSVGDHGNSGGLYQENTYGRGAGIPMAQRFDPEASTRRAAAEIKATIRAHPTADPGTIAVLAQRPQESLRADYAADINRQYAQLLQASTAGAPGPVRAAAGAAPAVLGAAAGAAHVITDAAHAAAGRLWPVSGQAVGSVINPFGGVQYRNPGATGALPATNTGADLKANYGDPVVAEMRGVVKTVYQAKGDNQNGRRDGNENYGYGGSVVVQYEDGSERRYSHLAAGSARVQVGEPVAAGHVLGAAGDSGNASAPHVDYEVRVGGKLIDGTKAPDFVPAGRANLSAGIQSQEDRDQGGPARPTPAPRSTTVADAPAASTTLTRLQKNYDDLDKKIAALQARQEGMDPDEASLLDKQLAPLLTSRTAALAQVAAEENRIRDDAKVPAPSTTAPTTHAGPGGTTLQWKDGKWQDSGIPVDPAAGFAAGDAHAAAELALRRAQQQYDAENDPVKKETARVALEQAKQALETSRQAAARADRPGTVTGPDGTVYQLNKDTQLPDLSTGVKLPGKPTTTMVNGRQVVTDDAGAITSSTDLMTPQERDWDKVKQDGAAEALRLSNQAAQGLITQRERDDQWKDWYNRNVDVPMKQAQEERARAAEARAAEADRRAAAAAAQKAEMERQQFGYTAGRDAVADELKMLPNRVGGDFFAQKTANEALIAQGKPGQYSASAFTTPTPDLANIAHEATVKALAGISPYAATLAGVPPAAAPDYSKINLQNLLATAPAYGAPGAAVPGMPAATAPPVPLR